MSGSCKQIVLILSRLSDSVQGRRDSYFQVHIIKHRLYISALEQARVLILGKYVLQGVINIIYKHCHISALTQPSVLI